MARRRGSLRAVRAPAQRESHQLGIHRDRPDEARRLLRRRPGGSRARREGSREKVPGEQRSGRHDAVFTGVDRQRSAAADALDAALVGRSAAPDRVRERDQSSARARLGPGPRERRADGARGDARGSGTRAADRIAGLQPRRNRPRLARRDLDAGRAAIGQPRRHPATGGGHPEWLGDRVRGVGGAGGRRVDRPHPCISDPARQHPAGAPKRLARGDRRSRTEPPPQCVRLRRSRPVARAARGRRAARAQPHARPLGRSRIPDGAPDARDRQHPRVVRRGAHAPDRHGHPGAARVGARGDLGRGGQRPSAVTRQHRPRHRRGGSAGPPGRAGAMGHMAHRHEGLLQDDRGCRLLAGRAFTDQDQIGKPWRA